MLGIWLIFIVFMLISWLVGRKLKSKFKAYSKIPTANGMSGRDVAEKMLRDHGIVDVRIGSVQGQLTDHYNPVDKTVNLSPEVFHGKSIASAAVAAHECGHAVQHDESYAWLKMRSALVPFVSYSSRYTQWILLAGILLIQTSAIPLLVGIVLFGATTLFSFITLPVEIDASRRGLAWLSSSGVTNRQTQSKAFDALKWAAYTYVVAALASLATLLYYIMIFLGRRS